MDSDSAGVVAQLKGTNPMSLVVYMVDGETKNLAVPQVRRKWAHLRKVLDNLAPWARLEAIDRKGNICAVVDNPRADDSETLDLYAPSKQAGDVAQLVQIMLKAQDVALSRQGSMLKSVLDNNAQILSMVSQRLGMLEKNYMQNLELVQDFAQAAASAAGEDGKGDSQAWEALIELAPQIPALLKAGREVLPGNNAVKPSKGKK